MDEENRAIDLENKKEALSLKFCTQTQKMILIVAYYWSTSIENEGKNKQRDVSLLLTGQTNLIRHKIYLRPI